MNKDFEKLDETEKEELLAKATSLETLSKLDLPKDILEKIAGGSGTERVEEGEPCPNCGCTRRVTLVDYNYTYCVCCYYMWD